MTPKPAANFVLSAKTGRWHPAVYLCLVLAWVAGCTSIPRYPSGVPASVPPGDLRGHASWYGRPFHGRKTSNGETFNMYAYTAAHRTLPFGSWVRVERIDNGKSVDVRINDRGPFVPGRVIDLSRRAAARLGILSSGVASVRIIPLSVPSSSRSRWFVLVGGFSDRRRAQAFASGMRTRAEKSRILKGWNGNSGHYHVRLEGFRSKDAAMHIASRLRRKGYGAFLVRVQ